MNGVDDGARTHDDRSHNPALYQLNYIHHKKMARQKGFEPLTYGLEIRCSIQLSYWRTDFGSGAGTRTPDTRIMIPML